jgi:hypothetical protein
MADLLTTATLAKWTQQDPDEVAADDFAIDLIAKASALICYIGGHDGTVLDADGELIPEWGLEVGATQAPIDVQMVALQVIKRSYENPGQVLQEGAVGPLGGDRVTDVQALFMELTERERATVARYNINGDPTPAEDAPGIVFVLPTTRGDETFMPQTSPLYVPDDQQINIGPDDSAYPTWDIPLFNPGDPGDDANYDDE